MAAPGSLFYAHQLQDVGGLQSEQALTPELDAVDAPLEALIRKDVKGLQHWEVQTHAFYTLLLEKGLASAAAVRRSIEALPPAAFQAKSYYEKWAAALASIALERGTVSRAELDAALGQPHSTPAIQFQPGDCVRVRPEDAAPRYRKPHLRTPGYLFGVIGRISDAPVFHLEEPDASSYGAGDAPKQPVYRVVFSQKDVWEGYGGSEADTIDIEIWQPWLEPSTEAALRSQQAGRVRFAAAATGSGHIHSHAHAHEHGQEHGHVHEERAAVEQTAVDREGDAADRSAFSTALIQLFLRKGLLTAAELRQRVELLESWGQAPVGPRLVARAWADPAFKRRLLADGSAAAQELGFSAPGYPPQGGLDPATRELTGNLLVCVEDTPEEWHLIVCTLCSCYPVHILGLSPSWYKSRAYRARSVRDPRGVLREFGTELPPGTRITVHDSTADTRYIKLPLRPAGAEGWSEARLASLATRDSLIGVAHPKQPQPQ